MLDDLRPENAPFDGRWWSAEDASHVVAGRLELEEEFWRLTLFGLLGPWGGYHGPKDVPHVIHGEISATPVTLLNLVLLQRRPDGVDPPHTALVAVNKAICGSHGTNSTKFTRANVRLLHLNEWANRRPWTFRHRNEEAVAFTKPDDLTAVLPRAKATLWRGFGENIHKGAVCSDDAER